MYTPHLAISTLGIILIAAGVVVAIALLLGYLGIRARNRRLAPVWERDVAAADAELEQARAGDRGWERDVMVRAAQRALDEQRPGWSYHNLHLVLVDDRPGKDDDRAHFVAVDEHDKVARVVLGRRGDQWTAESVE